MQQNLLILFLVLTVITLGIFVMVFRSSKTADEEATGMKNSLSKRMWFIAIMFVSFCMLAFVTIPRSPYYYYKNEQPSKVVYVTAGQYMFFMSPQAIDPEKPSSEAIELQVDELVEFRVTSKDVTHGFAVYDENSDIVVQTQAMPGYVNNLRWKFSEPGTYEILCLEYCGAGHQLMKGEFIVK